MPQSIIPPCMIWWNSLTDKQRQYYREEIDGEYLDISEIDYLYNTYANQPVQNKEQEE